MKDFSFRLQGTNGKGVILIHGLTGAPGEMKFQAKILHRRGFSVYAPTLAGHGGDMGDLLATTWRDWLESLREAYDGFSRTIDEVYVAGICVGGALGLALAAEEPGIRGQAVYSMTYRYDGWNMKRWYGPIAPFLDPFAGLPGVRSISFEEPSPFGFKDERLREAAANAGSGLIPGALSRLPFGAMQQMHRLGDHVDRIAPRVTRPTLIVHARDDDMSDPKNAYRLQRALGPSAQVALLDDCYHMVHVDQQRDLVGGLTADFFGAAPATPRPARPLGRTLQETSS